ncbi:unnamed protein product [Choristocarpus tenellus]
MTMDPDKLRIIRTKPKIDSHPDAIREFVGDYECFANTYRCSVSLCGDTETYPSVEHAFQASKTNDQGIRASIRVAKNGIEAKKAARVVKTTEEWKSSAEKTMEGLVRDKFRRNAKAREVLLSTGRVKLVFSNQHSDRVWGVCDGKGQNKLGKLLELVRAEAHAGKDTDAWCKSRFELAPSEDVAVSITVTKGGEVVAETCVKGKAVMKMGKEEDSCSDVEEYHHRKGGG